MLTKIIIGAVVALSVTLGGAYLANANANVAPDCCFPGSPCCEDANTCCLTQSAATPVAAVKSCCTNPEAGLMPDCCFPGSVCCEDQSTCCLTAKAVVTKAEPTATAEKSCCGTGAACCEADAAK
jgi:hypothetical protein